MTVANGQGQASCLEPGVTPDLRQCLEPRTEPDVVLGVEPGTEPDVVLGVEPGTEPGVEPGMRQCLEPGTGPGVEPGTEPDIALGIEYCAEPGMDPDMDLDVTASGTPTLDAPAGARALRVTAVFDALADQVQYARHFAAAMLRDWPVADDAALVVSEFSANAVSHSASGGNGKFWVHLEAYPGHYAWVEVRDQGGPWISREHSDDRPHGLEIVGLLAADHGVEGDARSGWIAWARLELPKPDKEPE